MLKRLLSLLTVPWRNLFWRTAILTVAACAVVLASAPSFRECVDRQYRIEQANQLTEYVEALRWCGADFLEGHGEPIVALGTVVIGIFTIVLGLGTVSLANSTKKLAEVAQDTALRQLRAYVQIHRVTISPLDTSNITNVEIVWENTGQTPAYDATCWGTFQMLDFPLKQGLPSLPVTSAPARFIILPDRKYGQTNPSGRPPLADEIQAVRDGAKVIFAYGEIRYRDVFKIERIAKFRYACGGKYGPCGGNMWACEEGNEAD
jgi:hypothetical protein